LFATFFNLFVFHFAAGHRRPTADVCWSTPGTDYSDQLVQVTEVTDT